MSREFWSASCAGLNSGDRGRSLAAVHDFLQSLIKGVCDSFHSTLESRLQTELMRSEHNGIGILVKQSHQCCVALQHKIISSLSL